MAREYNWNVKNKASKGYEVNMYTRKLPALSLCLCVYRKLTSLCYNLIMVYFTMKLKQGEIYINSVNVRCILPFLPDN